LNAALIVAGSQEKTKGRLIDCCDRKVKRKHEIKITIICVEITSERTDGHNFTKLRADRRGVRKKKKAKTNCGTFSGGDESV